MAHGDLQAGPGREGGQLGLPQPGPVAVGAAAVGADQQPGGVRVGGLAGLLPPGADRLHRERGGVMVGADGHPPGVRAHVVHPVRGDLALVLVDEVVDADLLGTAPGAPLPAAVPEVADVLFLLGVHADHRLRGVQVLPGPRADVPELGVPVGVPGALGGLGVALQAEAFFLQQLRHRVGPGPVPLPGQLGGQVPQRQGRPPQRRLRVPPRAGARQRQQRRAQPRVGVGQLLAAPARPPGPAQRLPAGLSAPPPQPPRSPAHPRRPGHRLDPAMP